MMNVCTECNAVLNFEIPLPEHEVIDRLEKRVTYWHERLVMYQDQEFLKSENIIYELENILRELHHAQRFI